VTRRIRNPEYKPVGYAPIPGLKVKSKTMDGLAKLYLDRAGELFAACDSMDTAVRDSVCTGLAYLVNAGYDCQACSVDLDQFHEFVDSKTAEWFRSRGFAEWFCIGASRLFNSSKPRILQWSTVRTKKVRGVGKVKTLKAVEVA
jgi:hypothetical protein